MERINAFSRVAFGTLVFMFVCALWLPVDARDKSGVLKASDLIGTKVYGVRWQESRNHQRSCH